MYNFDMLGSDIIPAVWRRELCEADNRESFLTILFKKWNFHVGLLTAADRN